MTIERRLIALAALAAGFLAGCGRHEEPSEHEGPPVPVRVVELALTTVTDFYEAAGTLRGEQTAVMTSKVSGYVEELAVEPGDRVTAGQTLAVLDATELEARLRAAQNALGEAEEARAEAEAGLVAAEAQAAVAAATYERFRTLSEQRAVTRQELDEVEARHESATADRKMAEARLRRASSALARARAERDAAEVVWGYTRVRAPFDGRVLERRLDLGNLAAPGTPLFVLQKEGALRAEVFVEESMAGRVKVGDPAEVLAEAIAEPIPGTVVEIFPSVEPASRDFLVKVELPPDEAVSSVPGRFVRVRLAVGETERLLIPSSAVVARGQLSMVYVVEDGEARLRLVSLGRERGEHREVLSGLTAGDRVIREPVRDLSEGMRVEARS